MAPHGRVVLLAITEDGVTDWQYVGPAGIAIDVVEVNFDQLQSDRVFEDDVDALRVHLQGVVPKSMPARESTIQELKALAEYKRLTLGGLE